MSLPLCKWRDWSLGGNLNPKVELVPPDWCRHFLYKDRHLLPLCTHTHTWHIYQNIQTCIHLHRHVYIWTHVAVAHMCVRPHTITIHREQVAQTITGVTQQPQKWFFYCHHPICFYRVTFVKQGHRKTETLSDNTSLSRCRGEKGSFSLHLSSQKGLFFSSFIWSPWFIAVVTYCFCFKLFLWSVKCCEENCVTFTWKRQCHNCKYPSDWCI